MAYPPPVPPATRTDATVMATNHPADHNLISLALTEILNHVATMEQALYPIGTISMIGADLASGNHLLCQGQAISRAAYPEVFALIGTKFGAGDGVNTFNLPAMQGRSPMGLYPGGPWATALGQAIGNQDSTLPYHDHDDAHQHGVNIFTSYTDTNHYHVVPTGGKGFVVDGVGNNGSAGIGSGTGYVLLTQTGNAEPNDGRMNHRHAVNGTTDGGPSRTGASGASATNTNIHPVVVLNFQMRMH